jgi:hypothetical protein
MDNTSQIRMTPRDFFLQLGITITLYAAAIIVLNLAFSIIDTVYPKVSQYYHSIPTISWPVAALIVVFPTFLILSWFVSKNYKVMPEKMNLTFRKWIVYATLFITAIALIIDLITVLYFFLDGQDLTKGFLLKALMVLIVAGGVFKYYFFDLKGWLTPMKSKLFALGSAVIIIGLIAWGFSVMGSPRTQRMVRYDQQKVNHLSEIQSFITSHYQAKQALPNSLSELQDPIRGYTIPKDPQTNTDYTYQKTGDLSFKLCANFNRNSRPRANGRDTSMAFPIGYDVRNSNWEHGTGEVCFDRTIDPDLYPPIGKPIIRQ